MLFISCKKKENAEPKITITSPESGKVYIPGDTIRVEADISDDGVLESVTLKLLNAAYTPVDHQESFSINSSSYHLSYEYVIENIYLETGNYFITLSTSDADNDENEFRSIFIQGIPKTRKAIYVLTQTDTSHIEVNKLDSANQLVLQFDVSGDYSGSAISSRFKELNVAGKITGAINKFDLISNSLLFYEPAYNAMIPSFQNLFFTNELTFVSYYDGRIKAFDKNGQVQFNSAQPVYYRPGALCVNDKYVFAEAYYAGPGENRLVVLNYPSGIVKQEYNAGLDIASMISKEDNELIIFGNKNGDGKIYQYHVLSNGTNDFHTLFSNTIYSVVAIDNDRYAIATANGLYSYQESSNNLIPVDLSEPAYSLEYDEVNGILFVNAGRKIKEYAFPDAVVLNTVISGDSLLDIRIQYNK
ncbi:MAG: Ig-like domain-containing protein [Bacteroidetes bacterium]|nr:Ig-like domain-containing protein [Bacteroidota bacterium]